MSDFPSMMGIALSMFVLIEKNFDRDNINKSQEEGDVLECDCAYNAVVGSISFCKSESEVSDRPNASELLQLSTMSRLNCACVEAACGHRTPRWPYIHLLVAKHI